MAINNGETIRHDWYDQAAEAQAAASLRAASLAIANTPMNPEHPHYVDWAEQVEGQWYMGA